MTLLSVLYAYEISKHTKINFMCKILSTEHTINKQVNNMTKIIIVIITILSLFSVAYSDSNTHHSGSATLKQGIPAGWLNFKGDQLVRAEMVTKVVVKFSEIQVYTADGVYPVRLYGYNKYQVVNVIQEALDEQELARAGE